MSRKIVDIKAELYHVPLEQPLSDAKHGTHTFFELVLATVLLEDGSKGTGYTYTGGVGGRAIFDMIEHDLKPKLIGQDATAVESLWDAMQWHIHYVGRGGIASFAISAIDIALWDLRARKAELPLYKLLGGTENFTKAYYGGIDLGFTKEKLLNNIQHQIASGHRAVKIKLGQKTLAEDIDRIKAVRETIGPDIVFMVDANYSWSVNTSIKALEQMAPYDILWMEEPTIPDDYIGYKKIADHSGIGIAMGENLHTIYEHRMAMEIGHVSFIQPDASNIGGITGWMKVATMAEGYNVPVCTHGMQELHVSLLAAIPNNAYLEVHSFPIDQYTKQPLVLKEGLAYAPETIGTGVEFDMNLLGQYKVL